MLGIRLFESFKLKTSFFLFFFNKKIWGNLKSYYLQLNANHISHKQN